MSTIAIKASPENFEGLVGVDILEKRLMNHSGTFNYEKLSPDVPDDDWNAKRIMQQLF